MIEEKAIEAAKSIKRETETFNKLYKSLEEKARKTGKGFCPKCLHLDFKNNELKDEAEYFKMHLLGTRPIRIREKHEYKVVGKEVTYACNNSNDHKITISYDSTLGEEFPEEQKGKK